MCYEFSNHNEKKQAACWILIKTKVIFYDSLNLGHTLISPTYLKEKANINTLYYIFLEVHDLCSLWVQIRSYAIAIVINRRCDIIHWNLEYNRLKIKVSVNGKDMFSDVAELCSQHSIYLSIKDRYKNSSFLGKMNFEPHFNFSCWLCDGAFLSLIWPFLFFIDPSLFTVILLSNAPFSLTWNSFV